jgi:chromosome segregation ATPase
MLKMTKNVDELSKKIEGLEMRSSALVERQAELAGELETLQRDMGEARLSGSSTQKIHQAMTRLEGEEKEITAELKALEPVTAKAQADLKQTQAENAAAEYAGMLADCSQRGLKIFQDLEKVQAELAELAVIQDKMRRITHVAGRLAPVIPDDMVDCQAERDFHAIEDVLQSMAKYNGTTDKQNRLELHGLDPFRNRYLLLKFE